MPLHYIPLCPAARKNESCVKRLKVKPMLKIITTLLALVENYNKFDFKIIKPIWKSGCDFMCALKVQYGVN